MGTIVSTPAFLGAMGEDARRTLTEAGVHIADRTDTSDLDLPPRAPEEAVVGRITDEEAAILRSLVEGKRDFESRARAKISAALSAASAMALDPTADIAALSETTEPTEEEARIQYRLSQGNILLHAMLHWRMGERLGLHDFRLGVRKGGVIVSIERRW